MKKIGISVRLIISVMIFLFLISTFAEGESKTISKTNTDSKNKKELSEINVEINNLKSEMIHLKDTQEKIYNSTISILNWEFNVIIFAIGLIGVILAVFGIKIVRTYLDQSIKNKISELTDMKIESMVNERIIKEWGAKYNTLYDDYDKKFSEKYIEFSGIVDNKKKS